MGFEYFDGLRDMLAILTDMDMPPRVIELASFYLPFCIIGHYARHQQRATAVVNILGVNTTLPQLAPPFQKIRAKACEAQAA